MQLGDNVVSLKGEDDPIAVRQRASTLYHTHNKPNLKFDQKAPHGSFNKQRGDWILQNKFEYGYFTDGGRRLASKDTVKDHTKEH